MPVNRVAKLVGDSRAHCLVLVLLVVACFGQSLGGYFLADDFLQVSYLQRSMEAGESPVEPLRGTHMQSRLAMPTLMLDYSIWQAQPGGFFLSNLAYYAVVVVLFYFAIRELTSAWSRRRSAACAFLSAALFAVNPLHCETVCWISGRAESLGAILYLAALYAMLRGNRHRTLIWRVVAILLIASLAYFFRLVFLGTTSGGYDEAMNEFIRQSVQQRWSDPSTVARLLFPFNYSLLGDTDNLVYAAGAAYLASLVIIARRIMVGMMDWGYAVLLVAWLSSTVLLVWDLWGLGADLEGARFYFLASMPLSALLPVLLLQPPSRSRAVALPLFLLFSSFLIASCATASLWVHVGDSIRALTRSAAELAASTPPERSLVLIGLPKDIGGVHTFYNAEMFRAAVNRPFQPRDYSSRFQTVDPLPVSPAGSINTSRLTEVLQSQAAEGPYVWDFRSGKLVRLEYAGTDQFGSANIRGRQTSSGLQINPLKVDFLEGCLNSSIPRRTDVTVSWEGARPVDASGRSLIKNDSPDPAGKAIFVLGSDRSKVRVRDLAAGPDCIPFRIRLSATQSWFIGGTIEHLTIAVGGSQSGVSARNLRMLSAETVVPAVDVPGAIRDISGAYVLKEPALSLIVDASRIPEAAIAEVQVTKRDHLFSNFLADQNPIIAMTLELQRVKDRALLGPYLFPQPGYYQIRARALTLERRPAGEFSDPITIHFTGTGQS